MAEAYLRVKLAVRPTGGGAAQLVVPPELEDVNYRFVLVKDGAEEGIVVIDEAPSLITRLQRTTSITRLSGKRLAEVRAGYPPPRVKQKYRVPEVSAGEAPTTGFETDEEGRPVVEAVQTVRSGFYLIDVPVISG
ncbi:hypothetical protein ADK86_03230 [Streptomyces sp. NRRL F-5755]|uniref:hypothetical protein n=1 Tax=Streptomyces sp. NRRL F-5755 TaxID=1519475 RepID=UPI0006ADBB0B|nr:hypothetical protein [Streptomyces sp. NRRL F-5755]KOU08787.1 hypothetical protein ADK86_03230 [Streptomyces sp. NRRL F-5755]